MTTRCVRGPLAAAALAVVLISPCLAGLAVGCVSSDSPSPGDAGANPRPPDATAPDSANPDTSTGVQDAPSSGEDTGGGEDARDGGGPSVDASDAGPSPEDASAGSDAADSSDSGCTQDLSNIGAGDFRIAFTVQTTATVGSAVINQRGNCAAGIYWDIRMQASGPLTVETDNNTLRPGGYTNLPGTIPVNDGIAHAVVVTRTSTMLAIRVDGVLDPTDAGASSTATFDTTLGRSLTIGVDVCDGVDGTTALDGTVTDVCVGP
jgi:hypothetical protein